MIKNNIERIIFIAIIIIAFFFVRNSISSLKFSLSDQIKLTEALTDSVRTYQTKEGNWASEKKTIQGDMDDLLNSNVTMSRDLSDLLNRVKRLNKENKKQKEIFAAASIKYKSFIDSTNSVSSVVSIIDTTNNSLSFQDLNDSSSFRYNINILNVRPQGGLPEIKFNYIDFPNEQFISFNFDKNKRKDYPISFTVTNTNKYYRVLNIESYAIPGIQKDMINPTIWIKFKKFIGGTGKYIIVGGAGATLGYLLAK